MYHIRRLTIAATVLAVVVFTLWLLPRVLNPTPPSPKEQERDRKWIDSSPYWLDRQACQWLSLCGVHHVKWDPPSLPSNDSDDGHELAWTELRRRAIWLGEDDERLTQSSESTDSQAQARTAIEAGDGAKILKEIPDYVLQYAPLVHLYSGEKFWPSDILEHVKHMTPFTNGSAVNETEPWGLDNLGDLNHNPKTVFLNSKDDVETRPAWLHSNEGTPTPFRHDDLSPPHQGSDDWGWKDDRPRPDGTTWYDTDKKHPTHRLTGPVQRHREGSRLGRRRTFTQEAQSPIVDDHPTYKPNAEGYSKAPAVLVLVDKGSGVVDAFWFFFYSYNLGQTVLRMRFGNHIGDWEHCMVRFENGLPRGMFLSEHAGGKAYAWQALETRVVKKGNPGRPVIYSAVGSHAMYAVPGNHPYVLPFGMLADQTDKGPLWDPSLHTYSYYFDYEQDRKDKKAGREPTSLVPTAANPKAPTSWFHFRGYWGDDVYELRDERQWRLFGQYHYVTGPTGPKDKHLSRRKICQTKKCRIVFSLEDGERSAWY